MTLFRKRLTVAILVLLTLTVVIFILFNSSLNGEQSSSQSGFFTNLAKSLLSLIGIRPQEEDLSHFIRKAAHFTEYFAFGALCCLLVKCTRLKRLAHLAPIPAFVLAVCDEFIVQGATEGRSPQWTDVLIDTSGALTAVLFIAFIAFLRAEKEKRK